MIEWEARMLDELGRMPALPPRAQDLDAQDLDALRARAARSAPPERYVTVGPPPRARHIRAGAPATPVDLPPLVGRGGPSMACLRPGPAPRRSRLDGATRWVRGLALRLASAFR